jgi:hypothetical protein
MRLLHLSTRQYARILDSWVREIGLDPSGLRHAQHEAHAGVIDLSADQESSGSSITAWSLEAGEHGPLSWY